MLKLDIYNIFNYSPLFLFYDVHFTGKYPVTKKGTHAFNIFGVSFISKNHIDFREKLRQFLATNAAQKMLKYRHGE